MNFRKGISWAGGKQLPLAVYQKNARHPQRDINHFMPVFTSPGFSYRSATNTHGWGENHRSLCDYQTALGEEFCVGESHPLLL